MSWSFFTGTTTVCSLETSTTAKTRNSNPESEKSTTVPSISAGCDISVSTSSRVGRKTSAIRNRTLSPWRVERPLQRANPRVNEACTSYCNRGTNWLVDAESRSKNTLQMTGLTVWKRVTLEEQNGIRDLPGRSYVSL